jgi:hypothetical protein
MPMPAKHLVGDEFAKEVELFFEWDPQPDLVFGTGTPAKAGPAIANRLLERFKPEFAPLQAALGQAATRLQERGPHDARRTVGSGT